MGYLRRGQADVMLAGGCEAAITPLCISAFSTMRALSTRNDDPAQASRPFDVGRDGFALAEAGAFYVLETESHARARGARIYATLEGFGNSSDAAHITAPDEQGRGAARSMRWALEDAQLNPTEIGYINAHGTSTPLGDKAEVAAVFRVFGDDARASKNGRILMSSTKSMHGHCLGAGGGVEAVAVINAMKDGIAPPTIGFDEPDPECDLDYTPNEARKRDITYAMSNSFAFGGLNAVLVFGPAPA